ncbi:MAG: hypothetical protein AAGF84_00285 [Planctomycetota bacterium]
MNLPATNADISRAAQGLRSGASHSTGAVLDADQSNDASAQTVVGWAGTVMILSCGLILTAVLQVVLGSASFGLGFGLAVILCTVAAWHDAGWGRLPNALTYGGLVAAAAIATASVLASTAGLPVGVTWLSGAASESSAIGPWVGLALGVIGWGGASAVGYAVGGVGAGDVKLIAAVGGLLGAGVGGGGWTGFEFAGIALANAVAFGVVLAVVDSVWAWVARGEGGTGRGLCLAWRAKVQGKACEAGDSIRGIPFAVPLWFGVVSAGAWTWVPGVVVVTASGGAG